MLQQTSGPWGPGTDTAVSDSSERRDRSSQYTIKGIDPESVDMMRTAARRDGMKIGAWVSARMKEAATRSLSDVVVERGAYALLGNESDSRLARIEQELAEIARAQRIIMARMLEVSK